MILEILDEYNPEYWSYRHELYKEKSSKLALILECITGSLAGKHKLWTWMCPHALQLVQEIVAEEMDVVNGANILPGIAAITPEYIESWSVESSREQAPVLMDILFSAAETARAKENNKKKRPNASILGLFLWTSGCSRQTIDSLHRCGLCTSYTSVLKGIELLADHCIQLAVKVGSGIHVFCYDNMNISTSIFVEQRGSKGPAKVTSGTFGVVYKVRNGRPEDMKLAPILERFRKSYHRDIRPTKDQLCFFQSQLKTIIVRVLTKYCSDFSSYSKDPALKHIPRHPMPLGYVTEQFPIRATTIEEATIMRARDVNSWTRREVLMLGFGLFHLSMNLIWALLHVHRGSLNIPGSLTYFFTLMDKKRLGADHPDYHTLLSALTQILDGILINAWRHETGHQDLANFAATKPATETLLNVAGTILLNHATPMIPDPSKDTTHQNLRVLARDLLYVAELIRAISDGDIGRVEDFLPQLAMMFRGAGGNNYCTEILHFILNLKHVWTEEFA
ncbi:hypothetical protein BYT27DRAFT_7221623 [Phlegmacium glaucopus]|nr:hypothetical protein BYT27DRAFT_7221623 [Phlegmacium glaucopus]